MNKHGEIIYTEDDSDDREMFEEAYRELSIPNKLTTFRNAHQAYEYFNNTDKDLFLIISDINMLVMTGIQLRDKMQQLGELKLRSIPFLFLTTGTSPENLIYSYTHSVQGFFTKPTSYIEWKTIVKNILDYLASCTAPTFSNMPPILA